MRYYRGDLMKVKRGTIVHGCNAQGAMNSGVAKDFRAKFPDAYKKYVIDLELFKMELGNISIYHETPELALYSVITQQNYGRDPSVRYVSYDAIDKAFGNLFQWVNREYAVSMPQIGSGLGNGCWKAISEIILHNAAKHSFPEDKIHVYCLDV